MSKARKVETPQDEIAEMFGLNIEAEPEGDEGEPVEAEAPEPEPEAEPEAPVAVEETPEPEPEAEPEPIAASAEETALEKAEKRARALQAEVARLRKAAREREMEQSARFAPMPVAPAAVPVQEQPKKATGIPVRVTENEVYVDPAELERLVEERAAKALEERMKPTPEQVRQALERRTIESFVSEDPERHMRVWRDTGEAYQFLQLGLKEALQQTGATAYSADDLVAVARETGLDRQFAEFFPGLADHFDELVEADVTNNVAWKARIMRRIAAGMQPAGGGAPVTPIEQGRRPAPSLRPVNGAPKSLARRGGDRSPAPSAKEAEFEKLEREFRQEHIFFDPEKRRRMVALGVELQKTGYV